MALLEIEVDEELVNKASAIYDELGIDLATAIRMFLKRSVLINGIPFSMTLPRVDYKAKRAARALQELALESMRNGNSKMTLGEINAEIDKARRGID